MNKKVLYINKGVLASVVVSLLLMLMSGAPALAGTGSGDIYESNNSKLGHMRGFIYKSDDKTPLWGAQVVLQDVKSRRVFRSNVTDKRGSYEVLEVPAGDYMILILSQNKAYKVKRIDFLVKIVEEKTTFISFSLKKDHMGFLFFLLRPCCLASVISGTSLIPHLFPPKEEPEQSPTQL